MGIETIPLSSSTSHSKVHNSIQVLDNREITNSMSQEFHPGIFSFSNEFDRSQQEQQHHQLQQQQQHIAQQIRRDKLRVQGFDPPPSLVGFEEESESGGLPVYEPAGMLSEMFNFPSGNVATATELLENQISLSYRNQRPPPPAGANSDWFLHRQGMVIGEGSKNQTVANDLAPHHHHLHPQQQQQQQISNMNANSMQFFLMNPQQQRSPSPSPSNPPIPTSSTLHMLLPNPSFSQFSTWGPHAGNETHQHEIPGVMEGQGLSLSLSSSLQQMEAAKAEELRIGEAGMLFSGQRGGGGALHLHAGVSQNHQLHGGLVGSSIGAANILRNSKYAKAAQELLEEFCSVGRGQFKKSKFGRMNNNNTNNAINPSSNLSGGNSSSSSKDLPPLSAADRIEHQRRKVKLLSMLDEVERRYSHYCEQMQMVVNSFDIVMGFGAAVPYTSLAQKAMSRHFRCLKDAIAAQLKHSCELLGEKDAGTSGVTKGETPRLRLLEQSLRQQRAFHQMGMMEQDAWRPQRGLPERSVSILRAWLFEHFLHPYPSDADKHLLARQTGLSRNQVSNWFINARVRLWKPMVEEMYQQEAKDVDAEDQERDQSTSMSPANSAQTPTPYNPTTTTFTPPSAGTPPATTSMAARSFPAMHETDACSNHPTSAADTDQSRVIRFGTSAGDVSLTLGLRHHAGNLPEKGNFSVRDFGGV